MRPPTKRCQWHDPLFREIFEDADNCSMLSGKAISNPTPMNFAHILAKGQNKYPKFMYYKKNICLLTDEEHHLYDAGTEAQRQKYAKENYCNWQDLYDLENELVIEYNKMFG